MDERIPVDLSDEWEPVPRRVGSGMVEVDLLPEPTIIVGDDGPRIDWQSPSWPAHLPGTPV